MNLKKCKKEIEKNLSSIILINTWSCSLICSLGLSCFLLRQQSLSLTDVADEEVKVLQVLKHLGNTQIDEHASDLWRFFLADKVDDESEDDLANVGLNVRVRRRDSRQNCRSSLVELLAHWVLRRLEIPLVRINSGWC